MNHSLRAYSALLGLLVVAANPALAQTWDPVLSDSMNNTAMGSNALSNPDLDENGGCHNTASGADTLSVDTSGSYNTGMGFGSLTSNLTGNNNTGLGAEALYSNTSGSNNAATGYQALYANTTGANNTAFGANSLYSNTTGKGNAAQGSGALYSNTTGIRNLGIGNNALYQNTTGGYNIALGFDSGTGVTTGSYNIEIGASGSSGDSGVIRIGVQGTQTLASIAGIYGTQVMGGAAVYVTSTGQLGVEPSSERFKTDVATMSDLSSGLAQLRPVTFRYKTDRKGPLQYGLIGEEVAKIYPELVIRGADGQIDGVRYEELAPMLLNEVQQQQRKIARQDERLADQDAKIELQAQKLAELTRANGAMQGAIAKLLDRDLRVATR